jgi:hypothetical protein
MIRCVTSIPSVVRYIIVSVATLLLGLGSVDAQVTDKEHSSTTVMLSVRAIQASAPLEQDKETAARSDAKQPNPTQIDPELKDLEGRLINLPFSRFQLLASKEETITIKQKNSLQLPNGQKLTFRPMYMDRKKVGLWLNWRDRDGSEILNTRVHFDSNESVVTGTDCAHDQGLILAIKAVQVGVSD